MRFLPLWSESGSDPETVLVEGMIGVIMDVTELKEREIALEEEARGKGKPSRMRQLLMKQTN